LKRWLAELRFSRALAAVLLANLAALVILNTLELRPARLLIVYPLALGVSGWLLSRARVRRAPMEISAWLILWALAFVAFLTVPRLPYLLEWIPGSAVLAQGDDWGRLAELVSMTLSDQYPLKHFANQNYLLSHYYTPLYPMAFLKTLIPAITLKDAILAGNLLYHLLLVLSLLEVSGRLFAARRSVVVFFFLCTVFGGFDWLFQTRLPFGHAEIWPRIVFHALREVSSYFTGLYWVVHHFSGFYSVVLAFVFARTLFFRWRAVKPAVLGLLLVNAFYSSPFASAPAVLLGLPELRWLLKRSWRTRVLPLVAAVFLAPLFLYTNRVQKETLFFAPVHLKIVGLPWLDWAASFLLYLLLVPLIDLGGIPLLLLAFWRRFSRSERRYFAGAALVLASTYFVESIGQNNYSMRSTLLPIFVFYYLFAKYAVTVKVGRWRPVLAVLAVVVSVGTLREWAYLTYQPLMHSYWYWRLRDQQPPERAARFMRPFYRDLARDRTTRYYEPRSGDRHSPHKYNAEKMIRDLPVAEMSEQELELLRNPRRYWFW
jgi:hypothetical protein